MQPRYHLEMALLRWIHLRKLVPLTDLIKQMRGRRAGAAAAAAPRASRGARRPRPAALRRRSAGRRADPRRLRPGPPPCRPSRRRRTVAAPASAVEAAPTAKARGAKPSGRRERRTELAAGRSVAVLKDSFLSEVRKAKKFFFGTVVAQAQKIDFDGDKVVFTFAPAAPRAARAARAEPRRGSKPPASQLAGRKIVGGRGGAGCAAGGPPSLAEAAVGVRADAASFGETGLHG